MLTLRRKEVSLESLHTNRATKPKFQNAARRHTWFAWPGHGGGGKPSRKVGLDAAAEACGRDHGRERAVGAEAAPAADRGAPFGNAVGPHDNRNLRAIEN